MTDSLITDQAARKAVAVPGLMERLDQAWRIEIDGRGVTVGPVLGLRYVAELVARSDTDVSAPALTATVAGGVVGDCLADAGPVLDARALRDYRRRLSELELELDAADRAGDLERSARAVDERTWIVDTLRRDTGLGGRSRRYSDGAERARMRVSKAVHRAIDRVGAADPVLGRALRSRISTGYTCRYTSDPDRPIDWVVRR